MIALLVITSLAVVGLLIVFFTSSAVTVTPAIPVKPIEPELAKENAPQNVEDPGAPGVENAPPELTPPLNETLNIMDGLVEAQAAVLNSDAFDEPDRLASGEGVGDQRGVSDDTPEPREPTRQLRFQPTSVQQYAEWLDSAGIEIGVLGEDNVVYYASGLSGSVPRVREGDPAAEDRLYFNTAGSPLAALDQLLVDKAGLTGRGSIVLLFCGPETQRRLLQLEQEKSGGRPTSEILLTVFRVTANAGAFRLAVEEQAYR